MAAVLTDKKSDFVSKFVAGVSGLLDDCDALFALRLQYDSLGMSVGSGTPFEIGAGDLAGANAHLTPQEIGDAFASLDALKAVLLQGNITNLNKIRR